ncbi:DUF6318 family protein [Aeromicrobium alkaliterrae]|uniref:DUF6318 domain-containing protein n=1 Tax=Aeromicrobium alkaliterrae TaxID=302168 RepID=A0ABN2JMZ0_9ACTN
MGRPLLAPLAAIGLLTALLTGCQNEPEPKEPPPSASTPETDLQTPELPEAATAETPEGAEAFIRYYVEVLNYTSLTGDTETLQRASDDQCTGCAKYIDLYSSWYASGGSLAGGAWVPLKVDVVPVDAQLVVVVDLKIESGTLKPDSESAEEAFGESEDQLTFVPTNINGTWKVSQMAPGRQA